MKRVAVVVLVCCMSVCLMSCSFAESFLKRNSAPVLDGSSTYYDMTIHYPSAWTVGSGPYEECYQITLSDEGTILIDVSTVLDQVYTADTPGIDDYFDSIYADWATVGNATFPEGHNRTTQGDAVIEISYCELPAESGLYAGYLVVGFLDDRAYTVLSSFSEDPFKKYRATLKAIAEGIEFERNGAPGGSSGNGSSGGGAGGGTSSDGDVYEQIAAYHAIPAVAAFHGEAHLQRKALFDAYWAEGHNDEMIAARDAIYQLCDDYVAIPAKDIPEKMIPYHNKVLEIVELERLAAQSQAVGAIDETNAYLTQMADKWSEASLLIPSE